MIGVLILWEELGREGLVYWVEMCVVVVEVVVFCE